MDIKFALHPGFVVFGFTEGFQLSCRIGWAGDRLLERLGRLWIPTRRSGEEGLRVQSDRRTEYRQKQQICCVSEDKGKKSQILGTNDIPINTGYTASFLSEEMRAEHGGLFSSQLHTAPWSNCNILGNLVNND